MKLIALKKVVIRKFVFLLVAGVRGIAKAIVANSYETFALIALNS